MPGTVDRTPLAVSHPLTYLYVKQILTITLILVFQIVFKHSLLSSFSLALGSALLLTCMNEDVLEIQVFINPMLLPDVYYKVPFQNNIFIAMK